MIPQDTAANVAVASSLGSSLSVFIQSARLLVSKKDLHIIISSKLLNGSWFPLLGGLDAGSSQFPMHLRQ